MQLSALDAAIVAVYLGGITLFGVLIGRRQQSLRDYFLGNRTLPWWALAFSIVATETSTLTVIATPAVAFAGNLGFLQVVIGYLVARVILCLLFIPQYFRGEFYTAYELIEKRFGTGMKRVAAGVFLFTRVLAEGVRVAAVGLVVSVAFGLEPRASVALVILFTLVYTFFGGLRAVIWTDVVQMAIYLTGAAAAFFLLLGKIPGGWAEVTQVAAAGGKLEVFDFAFSLTQTYTFWSGLIGGTFITLASHGTDQLMVQRLLAARSEGDSQRALLASGAVVLGQFTLFLLIGVMLYAFHQHVPLIAAGESADRVFPVFIVREMPAGLAGLMVAAVFAAAMSTTSSTLNALSSSTVVDLLGRRSGTGDAALLRLSRRITLVWGAALVVLGSLEWRGLLETGLAIASITHGGLLGLFLLGFLNPRATPSGALAGMAAGVGLIVLLRVFTPLAWTWYVLVGAATTFLAGSLASGWKSATADERG